jgi:hypothetical protein
VARSYDEPPAKDSTFGRLTCDFEL